MRGPSAYAALFERLAAGRRGAFVPFVVLGDPDLDGSLEILQALARGGADALEVGLPFSDPVADGPAIQEASIRALSGGFRIDEGLEIAKTIRDDHPALPIGMLAYANLVYRKGPEGFHARLSAAGFDSILVPDAPLIESETLGRIAESFEIAQVLIAPPNAGEKRLRSIAARSRGYVYVTSRRGVTGTRPDLRGDAANVLRRLKKIGSAPALLGFGISRPAHLRAALEMGASGAIAGSAIAEIIQRHRHEREGMLAEIAAFAAAMRRAAAFPR